MIQMSPYLAVEEVLPDYQDVLDRPRLPVTMVRLPLSAGSLAGVDGPYSMLTASLGRMASQLRSRLKLLVQRPRMQQFGFFRHRILTLSGSSLRAYGSMFVLPLIYARSYVAEALYGDIPGAVFMNNSASGPLWVLECDQGVNATCLSGGVEFPIHPLDLNFNGFGLHNNNGVPICVGAFQPFSQVNQTRYDMVLGMSFVSADTSRKIRN
ncbi:hypothetical protein JVT61DRAFT_1067 [Boletus reticuloceps]|uniref:Uncharacterized protein n=1 Tax=Boletus reticuloceps TaxID=495285 RepID=A0A8I2YRS3_9AGAM|nr:hypothetical protein JVT61DRAFT_1067 [Boletus reticuloceps]